MVNSFAASYFIKNKVRLVICQVKPANAITIIANSHLTFIVRGDVARPAAAQFIDTQYIDTVFHLLTHTRGWINCFYYSAAIRHVCLCLCVWVFTFSCQLTLSLSLSLDQWTKFISCLLFSPLQMQSYLTWRDTCSCFISVHFSLQLLFTCFLCFCFSHLSLCGLNASLRLRSLLPSPSIAASSSSSSSYSSLSTLPWQLLTTGDCFHLSSVWSSFIVNALHWWLKKKIILWNKLLHCVWLAAFIGWMTCSSSLSGVTNFHHVLFFPPEAAVSPCTQLFLSLSPSLSLLNYSVRLPCEKGYSETGEGTWEASHVRSFSTCRASDIHREGERDDM